MGGTIVLPASSGYHIRGAIGLGLRKLSFVGPGGSGLEPLVGGRVGPLTICIYTGTYLGRAVGIFLANHIRCKVSIFRGQPGSRISPAFASRKITSSQT